MPQAPSSLRHSAPLCAALLLAACGGNAGRQTTSSWRPAPSATALHSVAADFDWQAIDDALDTGRRQLLASLPALSGTTHRLRLDRRSLRREDGPVSFGDLVDPGTVILHHRVGDDRDSEDHWSVFDPDRLHLAPLHIDRDERGETWGTVVRALPGDANAPGDRIIAVRFRLDDERPRPHGSPWTVAEPGGHCLAPLLLLADPPRVLFLHRPTDSNRQRLALVPLDGAQEPVDPLGDHPGSIQGLEAIGPNRVRFAADGGGWMRPHDLDLSSGHMAVASDTTAAGMVREGLLATQLDGGQLTVTVLRLPERLDLDTLLALVAARHPAVLRDRALLAAAVAGNGERPLLPELPAELGSGLVADETTRRLLASDLVGPAQSVPERAVPTSDHRRLLAAAHERLLTTLQREQTTAIEAWFQAHTARELLRIDEAAVTVGRDYLRFMQERHRAGIAVASDLLTAERMLEEATARHQAHGERLTYHIDSLRRLCGLDANHDIVLEEGGHRFDRLILPDQGSLHELALLNNPRLRSARLHLPRNLALLPEALPLDLLEADGSERAVAHHQQRHEQARAIGQSVADSLARFRAARRAWSMQNQQVAWALEQVRLARLYQRHPEAQTEQRQRLQPLPIERLRYYQAQTRSQELEADLHAGYTQLWRAIGSTEALLGHLAPIADAQAAKRAPTLWLWDSRRVLADPQAMAELLATAEAYGVHQIYCHLPDDAALPDDPLLSERLTILIHRAATRRIGVWALLGDQRWARGRRLDYLRRALDGVVAFNRRVGALEPRLEGIALGLRLDRDPSWGGSLAEQHLIGRRWLDLVRQARAALPPDVPLWIDAPADLFEPAYRHLADELLTLCDGVSLLFSDQPQDAVVATVGNILTAWPGLLEVGLDLGPEAIAPADLRLLIDALLAAHGPRPGYTGVALHDWSQSDSDGRP